MQTYNVSEWMTNLEGTLDQLEKAKTPDEKIKYLKDLGNHISFL